MDLDFNKDGKVDKKDDLNKDGKVDVKDAIKKNGLFDKKKDVNGDGKVDKKDDLNNDGKVDFKDALKKFGTPDKKKDVNGDGKVDKKDDINKDGKIDERDKKAKKDRLAADGKHGHKEPKGEITKETFVPDAVLVQAFTEAEFYLELQYPLTAPIEGPIDVIWTPATGSLDVEFKTASKANETVGFNKSLTPTKRKETQGAHYKLKYDNIVTEIGIDPENLPYSFVSGRDADPFVRIINGTLYIRLALEEGKMAQAVVHMNVNETKKSNTVTNAGEGNKNKKHANGSDPAPEADYPDRPLRITTEEALLD
jgi:hypothetical protein